MSEDLRIPMARISDLAPSLSQQIDKVVASRSPAGRHGELLNLAQDGIIFLASVALTDYRRLRPDRPSKSVEAALADLRQDATKVDHELEANKLAAFGRYIGLLRAASLAVPDGHLSPETTGRDRVEIRRLKAAITQIQTYEIKKPEHDLQDILKRIKGGGSEQFTLNDAWTVLVEYRNLIVHGNSTVQEGTGWPRTWPGYYEGMTPILEGALLESIGVTNLEQVRFATWEGTSGDEVATFVYQRGRIDQHLDLPVAAVTPPRKGRTYLFRAETDEPLGQLLDLRRGVLDLLRTDVEADPAPPSPATRPAPTTKPGISDAGRTELASAGTHPVDGPWCALSTDAGLVLVTVEGDTVEEQALGHGGGPAPRRQRLGGPVTGLEATIGIAGVLAAFDDGGQISLHGAVYGRDRFGTDHLTWLPGAASTGAGGRLLAAQAQGRRWLATLAVGNATRTADFDQRALRARLDDAEGPADALATTDTGTIRLLLHDLDGGGPGFDGLTAQWTDLDAHATPEGCWIALAAAKEVGTEIHTITRGPAGARNASFWIADHVERLRIARPTRTALPLVVAEADGMLRWWPWPDKVAG